MDATKVYPLKDRDRRDAERPRTALEQVPARRTADVSRNESCLRALHTAGSRTPGRRSDRRCGSSSSLNIGYFTVNPDAGDGFVDWDWLAGVPAVRQTPYDRHLHFDRPVVVKVNGKQGEGVILKP